MEIKLKFLTPAFLYGADQTRPEFRLPSLIGQMRYWWRMSQKWPEDNFADFKKEEGRIFGMAEDKKPVAKPFYIYLKTKPAIRECPATKPVLLRDGRQAKDNDGRPLFKFPTKGNGVSYFFYPFMRHPGNFKWLPPDSEVHFEIEFVKLEKKEKLKSQLLLSLFFLSRFGGLGARSRRGAGAIALTGEPIFDLTENDLIQYINTPERESLPGHAIFQFINNQSPLWLALTNRNRYKITSEKTSDWSAALNPVGAGMQYFRTRHRLLGGNDRGVDPDFIEEARALHRYYEQPAEHDPPNQLTKDAFGLPRIVNFTSSYPPAWNALNITPYKDKGHNQFEEARRASPLHITVNRDADNQFYCTLLILWDGLRFLPDNIQTRIKRRGNRDVETYPVLENPPADKLECFLERV